MRKKRKIKIRKEMKDRLFQLYQEGHGVAKKPLKEGVWSPLIHSHKTYQTYNQHVDKFADWCLKEGYRYRDDDVAEMVKFYMLELENEGKSAWTIPTILNALCKALGIRTADVGYKLPQKKRQEIKRSRQAVERDSHINPKHYELLFTFERCFGLRREKELEVVCASDFSEVGNDLYCAVKGKGGKARTVKAYGSREELNLIKRYLEQHKEGRLFPSGTVPSGFDAHSLRAEYAARVYHANKRPLETLTRWEIYSCRGNKKGEKYDKKALEITSKMLGHNRTNVVVDNYSYKF